ncbi:MAG TPA: hypothetical protein VMZ31_02165 [Phycisphaerae bacterium]|nr:hypothetical protein [Phycisphaerae bacterium]
MSRVKAGIRREDKPQECRTPIVPADVRELSREHNLDFVVEPSSPRVFCDDDYRRAGASLAALRGGGVRIIFGLKEIPSDVFEPGKVYAFFSHVFKGQPHNMPMLREILHVGATLIDYEHMIDPLSGHQVESFGSWAGRVGMAETLRALGLRLAWEGAEPNPFAALRPTYEYGDLGALTGAMADVAIRIETDGLAASVTPLVVGFIGYGNASQGAQEILDLLPHEQVSPGDLADLKPDANRLYKVVFREQDTVRPRQTGQAFDLADYRQRGKTGYESCFGECLPYLTVLINGMVWSDEYPRLVTKADVRALWEPSDRQPRLRVIGDVSCDIEGGIELTVQATSPDEPTFVYDPLTEHVTPGHAGRGVVIMAVDNLPAELARDASIAFSDSLKRYVPAICRADYAVSFEQLDLPPAVKDAVIVHRGELTPKYRYLERYL